MRMNLAQPVRKISSHSTYVTRTSHYTVIGALVGTMTGLGLILNKQKVLNNKYQELIKLKLYVNE